MSSTQIPSKPESYKHGGLYICNLPMQTVTARTDGRVHHRDGIELQGPHPCVVISADDFNDSQARGLIVVPTIDGDEVSAAKYKVVLQTWVRVITKGEARYVQVEQLRCIDRSRYKAKPVN